jgi:hypothetical protein
MSVRSLVERATEALESAQEITSGRAHDSELELDSVAMLVQVPRRRWMLDVLAEREEIGLSELTDVVAAREHGTPTSDQRKAVYVALYQNHVPTFEDAGVLLRDDQNTVRRGPEFETAREALAALREVTSGE